MQSTLTKIEQAATDPHALAYSFSYINNNWIYVIQLFDWFSTYSIAYQLISY